MSDGLFTKNYDFRNDSWLGSWLNAAKNKV